MAAASSGVTNSLSRAQIGQKELRFLIRRTMNERRRSIVISVVRFVVRVFIDLRDCRIVAESPLPLGEGWGEGLANTTSHPRFSFLRFAPSPLPSPIGRGKRKMLNRQILGALANRCYLSLVGLTMPLLIQRLLVFMAKNRMRGREK